MTPAPDPWAARLAAVLARDLGHPATAAALQALTADLPAAPPGHDDPARQTRQTILQLLDRRSTQILLPPLSRTAPTPLPAWPASPLQPVPGFHPAGLAGTSLIAASLDLPPDPVALESWLQTGADEVVLILGAPPPDLPPDPRLRLYCVQGDGLTPTEALNLGLRLARHQRCVVLSPGIALPPDFLTLTPALPAEYRVNEGPANGSAFLIDLDRRDLALAGGFNEHLSSTDFALEDLMARLAGLGLRASPVPHSHLTRPAAAPRPDFGSDNLRKTLLRHPDFAALCNRIIAAQMPQWTGQDTRAFGLLAADFTQFETATRRMPVDDSAPAAIRGALDELRERLEARFLALGMRDDLHFAYTLQMRFVGQAFEVDVPVAADRLASLDLAMLREQFDAAHRLMYMDSGGAGLAGKRIEVVAFRVGATAIEAPVSLPKPSAQAAGTGRRIRIHENRSVRDCAVALRPQVDAVEGIEGPLLVEDETSTIYIPPGWKATSDGAGNLIVKRIGDTL